MASLRPWSLGLVALCLGSLLACGDTKEPAKPAPVEPEPVVQEEPGPEALGDMNPAELADKADVKYALVPSPVETQAALDKAGIETKLATLVPERTWKLDEADSDRVAVRTGVIIADLLLTVTSSSKDTLLNQLAQIKVGMGQLEAGKDIDATLDDLRDRIQNDAVTRDELLKEFDELSNVVIPELEFNGQARIVPLIQAGSWLNGANLVGQAVKATGNPASADGILKQPDVVGYFQEYAKEKTEGNVPSMVANALDSSLSSLHALASKSESYTAEDIDQIVSSTQSVLSLL